MHIQLKEQLLQRSVSTFLVLIGTVAVVVGVYGWNQNQKMHNDLLQRLASDKDIVSKTGAYVSMEYFDSGSDCEYGGSCTETQWIFSVIGEEKCIYVDVVLHENFPNYHVVSVSPSVSWITEYLNGELVSDMEERVRTCDS